MANKEKHVIGRAWGAVTNVLSSTEKKDQNKTDAARRKIGVNWNKHLITNIKALSSDDKGKLSRMLSSVAHLLADQMDLIKPFMAIRKRIAEVNDRCLKVESSGPFAGTFGKHVFFGIYNYDGILRSILSKDQDLKNDNDHIQKL